MTVRRLPGPEDQSAAVQLAKTNPDKPHEWVSDQFSANPSKTCRVCGATERMDLIRVDRDGLKHHYVDAHGITMSSMLELPCPLYIGDIGGTLADTKVRVRRLDGTMDKVKDQVESIEDRLDRLEVENQELRARLDQPIDVTALVSWLQDMADLQAQSRFPSVPVQVKGLPYSMPEPVADLITRVAGVKIETPDPDDEG